MPTDFLVYWLYVPVAGIALLLPIFAFRVRHRLPDETPLSRRAILRGYCGVLVGSLIFAAIDATTIGFWKVSQGHITSAELPGWIPGALLYMFVLMSPLMFIAVTVVGLPLLIALSKIRLASVAGAMIIAVAFASLMSAWVYVVPFNSWCESHQINCAISRFADSLTPVGIIALGFSVFARLPLLRNPRSAI